MMLLLDVGNTRIKWACWDGSLGRPGATRHRDRNEDEWRAELPQLATPPSRVLVSNVAGPALAAGISGWTRAVSGPEPEFQVATREAGGLRNGYADPALLGVDRWLAMRAAWHRLGSAFVTVSAGTALTVDAVTGDGRHLGGWILPGHALMGRVLRSGTSDIALREAQAAAASRAQFGNNTAGAVSEGGWQALAATAARAAAILSQHGGAEPAVLVTGGDAHELARRLGRAHEVREDLVLEGLAVAACDREQG